MLPRSHIPYHSESEPLIMNTLSPKYRRGLMQTFSFLLVSLICMLCVLRLLDCLFYTNPASTAILRLINHLACPIFSGILFLWVARKFAMTFLSTWFLCDRFNFVIKTSFEQLASIGTALISCRVHRVLYSAVSDRRRSFGPLCETQADGRNSCRSGDACTESPRPSPDVAVAMQTMERAESRQQVTRESKTV